MSSEEKKPKHHHHHHPGGRVPIPQAREEIRRWREQYLQLGEDAPYDFIQSFFIPMHDIKRLYEDYQDLDPTGVRAYIGITDENEAGCSPLRLLLVPAKENEDFYRNHHPGRHAHNTEAELNSAAGESSVYDFTMPCPDVCAGDNGINS
jgi:hypothetical protein